MEKEKIKSKIKIDLSFYQQHENPACGIIAGKLSEYLKKFIKENHLSKSAMAKKINISTTHLQMYLRRDCVPGKDNDNFKKLVEILKISPEELRVLIGLESVLIEET